MPVYLSCVLNNEKLSSPLLHSDWTQLLAIKLYVYRLLL